MSLTGSVAAQSTIPVRTLGPILATSTENVGQSLSVRGTSDGHVLVGAGARQRVYEFDSTLKNFTVVIDSGTGTSGHRMTGLIPYVGDSTLLPDLDAHALLVLDAAGKQVRSMAPPHPQDIVFLNGTSFGRPGLDEKGRLVYRTNVLIDGRPSTVGPGQKVQMKSLNADSVPIVRGDFDTRQVDTVAWVRTPSQGRVGFEMKENPAGGPPNVIMHMLANPFDMADEWTLMSDGTVAVVRAHDYHVDWFAPDGSTRSSPKMPFDWRRYTDAERKQRLDSVQTLANEGFRRSQAQAPAGGPKTTLDLSFVPDSEFPEFWSPITSGAVIADLDDRLWILPTTSTNAANGLTYDVVNRDGRVAERVQLPKRYALVGFGPHHVVYLAKTDGPNTYLARALLQ